MKKLLLGIIGILVIFLSYFYIKPMNKHILNDKVVTYKAYNIAKDNNLSALIYEGNNLYHIHPGEKNPAKVMYKFTKPGKLKLYLFVSKKAKFADVKFSVYKNNQHIKSVTLTSQKKQGKSVKVDITTQDIVTILADKHGDIKDDIAYIALDLQEPKYKLKTFIIPFLWSLLFIYLLGKGYKYVGFNAYIGFLLIVYAEKLNFGNLDFNLVLTYTMLLFLLSFVFVLIYQVLQRLKKYKVATIISYIVALVLYGVPIGFIVYALNYHTAFTRDALFAVFQSTSKESLEFLSDYISIKYIILSIVIGVVIGLLLYLQERKETKKIEKSLLIFLIFLFASIVSLNISTLRLPNFVVDGFKRYGYEISKFKEVRAKRKSGKIKFSATKEKQGETYIFIIGESLNKNHMGVYGYFRDTTPNLTKMHKDGELELFNKVYSNHTHTVFVLDLALTQANQYNKMDFFDAPSIIDILKKAGFETYWLTNQPLYSIYDNMVSVIATAADNVVALNTSVGGIAGRAYYDGPLIDRVKKVLSKKSSKNRAIFVHLGGSHSTYSERYPNDKYTKFSKELNPGVFGKKASKVANINTYDNSVYYNDYVVGSIIKEFKKDSSAYALFYMSDHAEDVENRVGHNSSMFTFYMTEIPFIAYFSNKYKTEYSNRYKTILEHKNTLFSNDMLYSTLIGLYGIKTDKYNSKYDFSSKSYSLNEKDAIVLHGKKHYADKNNHIYWQEHNKKFIKDSNKTAINSVNSIGMLNELQSAKYKRFKIDLTYQNGLRVGVDNKLLGLSLQEFIQKAKISTIEHLLLDLKNLDAKNYQTIINELLDIENKFKIKTKTTLIISNSSYIDKFEKNGWNVAYLVDIKNTVDEVSNILKSQNINTIYIKQNQYKKLENLNVNYIIKFNTPLYDINFKKALKSSKYLENLKIKDILFTYDSQFKL